MEVYRGRGRNDELSARIFRRISVVARQIIGYQGERTIYGVFFVWDSKTQALKWFKDYAKMKRWLKRYSEFELEHNITAFHFSVEKTLFASDIYEIVRNNIGPEWELASEGYWIDSDERVEPARRQLMEQFDEELYKAIERGVVEACKGASFAWACKRRIAEKIESLARSGVELSQENIAAIESAFPEYCEEKREKCEKYSREWGFFNDYQSAQFLPIAEYA